MSAIEYLMNGGMALTNSELPDNEQILCNEFIKKFGSNLSKLGRNFQMPASQLSIYKMNFLFIGKDTSNFHFLFVDKSGGNQINYKDLSSFGKVSIDQLIHQIRIEFGEVHWAFSIPITQITNIADAEIEELANQYVQAILEAMKQKTEKISDDAITIPEIAKEIEAFNADHLDQKTAYKLCNFQRQKHMIKLFLL